MTAPGWRAPMLATLTQERFSSENWLYERKLDGVRTICSRDGDEPKLWSRNQKTMNNAYPEIVEALAKSGGERFVADGEIVAFAGKQTSFGALQPRIHLTDPERARKTGIEVFYYLFDLLYFDGHDATSLPLRQRKQLLADAFDFEDPLRLSEHRDGDGEEFFREACANGWEGLIAKRVDAPYQHGRSRDWLKFKCVKDQEFVIGGFTDPQGARHGFGALLLGYHDGDGLRFAGKVGTGYTEEVLRDLTAKLKKLERKSSPFAETVQEKGIHWVSPELVAQIGFSEWTGDGKLRHARYVGLRNDKAAEDVVREA
ncbi:non-homologous end-joining DNA ligase [Amycolatopsis sp. CA-230715]|uniref:non-homologous end-joining DNA ligase n=1 Tax=Amycolatopsis sp. CA-230715 TaxID=2745196 RepID=UPI001C039DFF|nr:non-homologous end-joining DNA ligase [Amycolatopsis sp. CA-230715]QWF80096.1 Multifunctional non-homologous end joining protein LigD [Amycolatopsis sp. CA-230715]